MSAWGTGAPPRVTIVLIATLLAGMTLACRAADGSGVTEVGVSSADSGHVLDEVLASLARRQHGRARFTQQQYLALLDRPLSSTGELRYDAPDRLEQRTLTPRPETFVYDHGQLRVQRGARHYQIDAQRYPQLLPFVESIRATLAGDRAALARVFRIEFHGALPQWTLLLVPSDSAMARLVSEVRISGSRDQIHTVEIRQHDGDHSVMTIQPLTTP